MDIQLRTTVHAILDNRSKCVYTAFLNDPICDLNHVLHSEHDVPLNREAALAHRQLQQ